MRHPALDWAASGGMWLTGHADAAPLVPRGPVLVRARSMLAGVRGAQVEPLLFGRAAWMGLRRHGRTSAGGASRLLRTADGWAAVSLARPEDVAGVGAIVGVDEVGPDPWAALADWAASVPASEVAERAQLLGVPGAALGSASGASGASGVPVRVEQVGPPASASGAPVRVEQVGPPASVSGAPVRVEQVGPSGSASGAPVRVEQVGPPGSVSGAPVRVEQVGLPASAAASARPVVVDFSSLWAGPLCAWLLGQAGAHVIKVESASRPDGARLGNQPFWEWLHRGQELCTLDLRGTEVRAVLERADVVIEASRPRALRRFGIVAEEFVAAQPGRVWVSITGYGRAVDRVAFGDDAAVAGGLVAYDSEGDPVFCGDAVADPLSGLAAAGAVMRSRREGGGQLLDVSMADVAAAAAAPEPMAPYEVVRSDGGEWVVRAEGEEQPVLAPEPPA